MRLLSFVFGLIFLLTVFCGSASAQTAASGDWSGVRTRLGKSDSLLLHISNAAATGATQTATVDLSDFGALDIPGSRFTNTAGHVHFELSGDSSTTTFDGTISGDLINGVWKDGALEGQFSLRHSASAAVPIRMQPVMFQDAGVKLSGTLVLPSAPGRYPAVVFVQGAGPETRSASMFLAQMFAENGIAALAYDKRGAGESTGDWHHSSFDDLAGDACAAVAYLKSSSEIDGAHIGLMGSSQGGWVAPLAATRCADVSFVIAKSAAAVTPEQQELWRDAVQLRSQGLSPSQVAQGVEQYRRIIRYARTRQGWDKLQASLKANAKQPWALLDGSEPRNWWEFDQIKSTYSYNPIPVLQRLTVPLLVIYGGEEVDGPVQTSVQRLLPALANKPLATVEVFPDAGHDLRIVRGPGAPWDFDRYSPEYLNLLITWVKLETDENRAAVGSR